MIYVSHLIPDEEMAEVVARTGAGVESIEFSIADNLDELQKTIKSYRKRLERIQPGGLFLHGPFLELSPAAFDSMVYRATMTRFAQCYEAGLELGAKKIVYHSGMNPNVYYTEGWAERTADFFNCFLRERSEIEVVMENVLDRDWRLLLDVKRLVEAPNFHLCLDIGHAHCYSEQDVREWAKGLASVTAHVHIHDNDGDRDAHRGLGEGTLPYREVLGLLPRNGERTWTIECPDKEAVLGTIERLNRLEASYRKQKTEEK